MNLHVVTKHFSLLYSIKYFRSVRNVFFFFFFSIKASFQQKKSDFMSFSLKRCIQACQFSPIYLRVRRKTHSHRHLMTFTASNVKCTEPTGPTTQLSTARLNVKQQCDEDI